MNELLDSLGPFGGAFVVFSLCVLWSACKYIFEEIKSFLKNNNFINKDWNALNFLSQNASTVGLIDLKILSEENEKNYSFFEKP